MRRPATRKGIERRRKPRAKAGAQLSRSSKAAAHSSKTTAPARSRAGSSSQPQYSAGDARTATRTDGAEAPAPSRAYEQKGLGTRKRTRQDCCENCGKGLAGNDRALFVEEEVGRIFCSEDCIAGFFSPEIARLEKEYFRRLASSDLSADDRESLAHLRWITLQEPDEIWREKTISGDFRYTLISEFQPGTRRVWCICICLFLRGEPSFLYLAFPTKNAAMVNHYRRGERVQWIRLGGKKRGEGRASDIERASASQSAEETASETESAARVAPPEPGEPGEGGEDTASQSQELRHDRLAPAWTEDETFIAQMNQERSRDDIDPDQFALYQGCLEETLETPDEVWSIRMGSGENIPPPCIYHFIRHYPEETPGIWYIIIARETEDDDEQIEIMDAFPTRDAALVERYRRGELEVGQVSSRPPVARVVH